MADNGLSQSGVLSVTPPGVLDQRMAQQAADKATAAQQPQDQVAPPELAGFIRGEWEIFRNHRNSAAGWSERLLIALRTFNGQYDATRLQEIRQFGGSEIYARIAAQKCRAASSLLRDIYLGQDRAWAVRPTSNPQIPDNVQQAIDQLLQIEQSQITRMKGQPPNPQQAQDRKTALLESAMDAAKAKAQKQADASEDKIEDLLRDGGFYHAFAEFLVDLPTFPFACIKGPVVRVIPTVTWPPGGGQPTVVQKPKLTWNRVSPFDVWWTPGVADIENANVIEKLRITRAELNDLLDLPGYNQAEIRAVLDEYGRGGVYDNWDTTDAERAQLENRENPAWNRSRLLTMMEFNGNVQGRLLQEYGMPGVDDELRDYNIQAWIIGAHVIKAHLSPSPRQRHPYFITSFEKVPGTPLGNGLVDLLSDMQEAANATLRSLVNNISLASGPQVLVNDDRLSPDEPGDQMYPWKVWHVRSDPASAQGNQPPIDFFMPTSNADQLAKVYDKFVQISDDVSAIPKYVGGGGAGGGAGRTASGMAMLMGNASKILQSVSANIDRDVMEPALLQLADLIMLTDTTGILNGEEKISVMGVSVAIQKETQRQRQIEFLQTTMNPTDMKIMGMLGRAKVLRAVSQDLGLTGEEIVPPDDKLEQMQKQEEAQQAQGPVAQQVQEGVQKGVAAGVQRIATELTAGDIAQQLGMPEGMPTHIGTPVGMPSPGGPGGAPAGAPPNVGGGQPRAIPGVGGGPGQPNVPGARPTHAPPTGPAHSAAIGQGTRLGGQADQGPGPRTSLVGNQPGPGARKPIGPAGPG